MLGKQTCISLHRTILNGFNAEFMRWRSGGAVVTGWPSGILLRGFGFRFMLYRLKPW
ncbi:hypothetical protein SEA_LEOPARD_3 [Mycobacterium phage Leopard]|uniref:Uncharacterized protein n=1 Tax=Mycobacterium phage Onyinye TaxID=2686235 RepID=A0A6B9L7D7_9CAUD|nr:hypothetical protein PP339_gp003 [Mycobacterium phage Onyinye]QHB37410.1 hypothetical protein SEA_ONYINYE_3 [Mycobacterium phage Onyinye]UOW92881.1 hypothetical protein SEA_LEOPARD_3 [Mycobacterium phage Leopard]